MSVINKKVDACVSRFKDDCRKIEKQQEDIENQRRFFQELYEQMETDRVQASYRCNDYIADIYRFNVPMAQKAIASQEQITDIQAQAHEYFYQCQESFAHEKRKLADKLEERESLYKEELRRLTEEKPDSPSES